MDDEILISACDVPQRDAIRNRESDCDSLYDKKTGTDPQGRRIRDEQWTRRADRNEKAIGGNGESIGATARASIVDSSYLDHKSKSNWVAPGPGSRGTVRV